MSDNNYEQLSQWLSEMNSKPAQPASEDETWEGRYIAESLIIADMTVHIEPLPNQLTLLVDYPVDLGLKSGVYRVLIIEASDVLG